MIRFGGCFGPDSSLQNPVGLLLAVLLGTRIRGAWIYRTIIFTPTILSVVIIGFVWKLILNPDAARMDGANEYHIYWLILPLVRPALGSVLAVSMIPIWDDLCFPLILAPGESTKTLVLGAQAFLGEFVNDYSAVLAALTLAILPPVFLHLVFSRQLIRGITAGAVK